MYRKKNFHTLGNSLKGGVRGNFRTSGGNAAIGTWKAKWREFTTEIFVKQWLIHYKWGLIITSGGWVLWLRHWGTDLRGRTRVGCHENTLRELVGPPERQESITKGTLLIDKLKEYGTL